MTLAFKSLKGCFTLRNGSSAAMQLGAFQMPEPEKAAVIHLDPPAIKRLDEVQVPTLIIAGTLDVAAILSHARMLAQAIARAQLELVSEAAHLPNMERPALFNEMVWQFIDHFI